MVDSIEQAHESLAREKKYWGKKLIIAAWIIEIIAALIGLTVAWSMGFQTYQIYTKGGVEFPVGKTFDLLLAAMPFIMVAGVELLKIPFAFVIYTNRKSNYKVKVAFSIVLVLVTFITFETLSSGFERQYSNITAEVDIPRNKLAVIESTIRNNENEQNKLESFNIESINKEVAARRVTAETNRDKELAGLESSKADYHTSANPILKEQRKSLQQRIKIIESDRDSEISRLKGLSAEEEKENKLNQTFARDENNKQIRLLKAEKKENKERIDIKNKDMGYLSIISTDITEWKKRNKDIDVEIKELRDDNASKISISASGYKKDVSRIHHQAQVEIDDLRREIVEIDREIALSPQFKEEVALLNSRIRDSRDKFSLSLGDIALYVAREEERLREKNKRVGELSKSLTRLNATKINLENEIIKAYSSTQIYRIAITAYGVERGQMITEAQISFVAKIWFGSLALIVSTMGIFLAFGSFVLVHPSNTIYEEEKRNRNRNRRKGSIGRSFRLMLVALTKRLRNPKIITKIKEVEVPIEVIKKVKVEVPVEVPVEVIKEIAVDKIRFKEIPIEIIKKEVVHIPIYTNDPNILKFGTTKVQDILKDD